MIFGEIIIRSLRLAWRYKTLWVLGLFVGGLYIPTDQLKFSAQDSTALSHIIENLPVELPMALIPATFAVIFLLFVVYFLVSCFCSAGLIDAVNRLSRGGIYSLGISIRQATRFFWRVLGVNLIGFLAEGFVLVVSISVLFIAFSLHLALGALTLLVCLPAAFLCLVALTSTFQLGSRAVVVRDIRMSDAIAEGWRLFMENKGINTVMFILYVGLTIVVVVALTVIFTILGLPFTVAALNSITGLLVALTIGLPALLILAIPIAGFLGVVFEALYTLFYFRLVEPAGAPGQNAVV